MIHHSIRRLATALILVGIFALLTPAYADNINTGTPKTDYAYRVNLYATPSTYWFVFRPGGPCYGYGSCYISNYATRPGAISIATNGRWWTWNTSTNSYLAGSGGLLTQIDRYMRPQWSNGSYLGYGPCSQVRVADACGFYERYYYANAYGQMREVIQGYDNRAYHYDLATFRLIYIGPRYTNVSTAPGGSKPRP